VTCLRQVLPSSRCSLNLCSSCARQLLLSSRTAQSASFSAMFLSNSTSTCPEAIGVVSAQATGEGEGPLHSNPSPHRGQQVFRATQHTPTSKARICVRTHLPISRRVGTAAGSCKPCGCHPPCCGSSCQLLAIVKVTENSSVPLLAESYSKIRFLSTTTSPLLVPFSSG
jgi:hypothetical protein